MTMYMYANFQPPIQLNSLTGTYATSTYLAALKKSPKELDSLAKDIETFDKKIKTDEKVSAFIGKSIFADQTGKN
jgi:F-type H+-transporting ATPase subunit O